MSFEIQTMPTANKQTRYEHLIEDIATLISGERRETSVMANVAAAIRQAFSFFWVGFYVVDGDYLHLGPFQGDVACYRIRHGRGVCGTAWAERQTLVVPDVDAFPGHIACSSSSRSEIVVPIMAGPKCLVRKFTGLFFTGKILRQFFNGVYDKWGGPWADRIWAFNPPPGFLVPWLSQEVSGFSLEMMRFHGWLSPPSYI